MADLKERLRARTVPRPIGKSAFFGTRVKDPLCTEAADHIAQLEAEVEELRRERDHAVEVSDRVKRDRNAWRDKAIKARALAREALKEAS